MVIEAPVILGDLGGTHLRLARKGTPAHGPEAIRSYVVREWPSLAAVLKEYAGDDCKDAHFLLSFARHHTTDGIYRFDKAYKDIPWEFSIEALKSEPGLRDVTVIHDFHAMALSLFHAAPDVFMPVVRGVPTSHLRAIIGVGTGLGHALVDLETKQVYDTFGGHFPPCAVSPEQKEVLAKLEAAFTGGNRTYVFEEILSGRGLMALYRAVGGKEDDIVTANDRAAADACRLFCEFLGLYANIICVSAHAFGGLYFSGGVIEKLNTQQRFDWAAFLKYYRLNMVEIMVGPLNQSPIYRSRSGYTALYGLEVYADGKIT